MIIVAVALWLIWLTLMMRKPVDNNAIRCCALELKRIADAAERGVQIMDRWEP